MDGLAVGVGAIEFANRGAGVMDGCVGYEGGTGGAASPIEAQRKSRYGADAGKEVLYGISAVSRVQRVRCATSRSSSVRS